MSFLGFAILFSVAAGMLGRAALTARNDEPHASLAQVISCVAYLALMVGGPLPLMVAWSTVRALQFCFLPTASQAERHNYYPEGVLPYFVALVALFEIAIWCLFQLVR